MEYTPREDDGENYGVGWFPILEIMGNKEISKISFPSSHVLNKELCALMAAAAPTNTVGPEEWEETIAADDCPPTANTITIKWPAAGKEAPADRPKPRTATGKVSLSNT